MLSLRTRGKNGIYYLRGNVTLGAKKIEVKEFSTGTSDRDAASQLKAQYETDLRNRLMFGNSAKVADGRISDAFECYLTKAKPPCGADVIRVGKLDEVIGASPLSDYREAWRHFRANYLSDHALAGQDRYRGVLQAAINEYYREIDLDPVKLKAIPFENERIRWLTKGERDLLISCYAEHIRPAILMLAFHGPRVQDALQIQWGSDGVDLARGAIKFNHEKTAKVQWVPIHSRVEDALKPLWQKAGEPTSGHVFLNSRGKPYQDTRKAKIPGGNPLRRVHVTALKKSGITNFTMHDWRHHWASHCVMAGIDLITIMHMGGWKSLRMVQRYSSVGVEHMRSSIDKLT